MNTKISYEEIMNKVKGDEEIERNELEAVEKVAVMVSKLVLKRVKKGYSQRELAEKIGMKQPALARIERLDVMPRVDTLMRIALALDAEDVVEIDKLKQPAMEDKYVANKSRYNLYNPPKQWFKDCRLVAGGY